MDSVQQLSSTNQVDVSVVIGFRDWGLRRIRLAVESVKASFGRFNGEVIISDYGSMTPRRTRR